MLNNTIKTKNIIDFMGFLKNSNILTPINVNDSIITNLAGNRAIKNSLVPKLASADTPLIKNDGVNGKQYKKKSTE